jgi:hypothetical protein
MLIFKYHSIVLATMTSTFTYQGKKVTINQPMEHPSRDMDMHGMHDLLSIDDADIHVMTLQDDKFGSHYFPYWSYDSIEHLAKDLIDKVPEFGPNLIKAQDQ